MTTPLALSSSATLQRDQFGIERQTMVKVDNALPDPDLVIEIASRHSFGRHGPFYPGLRAPVSAAVSMPLVEPLLGRLVQDFDLPRRPIYLECYLSVVTHAPGDLTPIQRLPHFDGVEPERLAVLLYLDRREEGGTAFYRQRATGFESVDANRLETYRQSLGSEVERVGLPGAEYIAGDTDLFERIHAARGRFNSMVIYRGNTLHCADLPADFHPESDPRKGRLTLNLFLA